jgi:hypothetical protein
LSDSLDIAYITKQGERIMGRTNERKQFLADIFTTALEGGIDYWACASEYHWQKDGQADFDNFYAIVSDCEGEDAIPDNSRIDREVIVKGINKIVNDNTVKINSDLRQLIREANRDNDASNIDADGADCIVQIGLLGELVFG